ncbi:hypothetical protein EYZ11_013286 [Aspergillus tanneri]|uniref:Uncharacterized protein n=1 Tax=Aspergillus tanneri TaxID=1220188 RepID=A0A4S3IY18_9EURO|nr:hypothetical protein EYZ11_013286 [Aspergillus tanneri]
MPNEDGLIVAPRQSGIKSTEKSKFTPPSGHIDCYVWGSVTS